PGHGRRAGPGRTDPPPARQIRADDGLPVRAVPGARLRRRALRLAPLAWRAMGADDLYEQQRRYYHLRAAEYDGSAWESKTEGHAAEVARIVAAVASLPPARTLDVGCGTGFLSRHLRGDLTLLDASADMLAIAAARVTSARVVHAEALPLPFRD